MDKLLTSYLLDDDGVHLSIGKMYGLLRVCKKCGRYEAGKCGNGGEGISVCRHGCAIYEEENVVYFGLHIKEYYKSNKALKFDLPFAISFQDFQSIKSYDRELESFKLIRHKALQFSREYDECITRIKEALPDPKREGWGKDCKATTIDGLAIGKVLEALNLLKHARQEFHALLSRPTFKDLLPFISNKNMNNSLIPPDSRCLRCRSYECNKYSCGDGIEKRFNRCSNGVSYINGFARTYCGICVVEAEKKKVRILKKGNKNRVLFSSQRLIDLICFINSCEYEMNTARRFLHDAGQFLAAIQNLLPYTDTGRCHNAVIKVSTLISINSMLMALQCLKRQLFESSRNSNRRHEFSPYQLFDKYRYCFGESYGRIRLIKAEGRDFYELISSYEGFEFAVLNLLGNAIKYLPSDEQCNSVDVNFRHYKHGIEITVESMGIKVDESDLPKLGMRWFRGRNAIDSNVSGEGLGLHAVVACMRRSGFSIKFSSSGTVEHINDIDYRKFSARIRIPQCYIVDKVE